MIIIYDITKICFKFLNIILIYYELLRFVNATDEEIEISTKIKQAYKKIQSEDQNLKYEQIGDLPNLSNVPQNYGLEIEDLDDTMMDVSVKSVEDLLNQPKKFDIWIDDKKIEEYDSYFKYYVQQVLHRYRLLPGLHNVKIKNLIVSKTIFNGQILFDGIQAVEIIIGKWKKNDPICPIQVSVGGNVEYENVSTEDKTQ